VPAPAVGFDFVATDLARVLEAVPFEAAAIDLCDFLEDLEAGSGLGTLLACSFFLLDFLMPC